MSDLLLNILPGTMSVDCYPASADAFQKQILNIARAVFPGTINGIGIGQTPPTNHDIPWARTDASGNLIRIYTRGGYGVWVSPHLAVPGSSMRYLWVGLEADLVTYDEGTSDPVTDTTGPFWLVDHALDARSPIGPGTLPSGTVIAPKGTGGEEKHQLTIAELAKHRHLIANNDPNGTIGVGTNLDSSNHLMPSNYNSGGSGFSYTLGGSSTDATIGQTSEVGGTAGAETPHNNMSPYYGMFIIRRSARIYYIV